MKQLAVLFLVLSTAFGGIWVTKMNAPTNRPNSYQNGIEGNYWWNSVEAPQEVSTNWKLSAGVPDNYIPVPGKAGLYMVVDEDGYIIGYKKGTKDENDQWIWEDTDPNIPENYEAVPGLTDVYKVTYDDGTVKYFKYVRNKDDTYAFVEVDAKGNMIGEVQPKGDEVPDNYERVNRNQYAVKNNNGVTIGYKERKADPTSDTGYTWVNIDEPNTNTAVELPGFDLTQDVTGQGDITGGTRPYSGYTASSGGNGSSLLDIPTVMPNENIIIGSNGQNGTFTFQQPSTQVITETYFITAPPGMNNNQTVIYVPSGDNTLSVEPAPTINPNMQQTGVFDFGAMDKLQNNTGGANYSATGTYVETETSYSTVTEGNDIVTYAQVVEKVYDSEGKLQATNKKDKVEVERKTKTSSAGVADIAKTLGDEKTRIVNLLFSANGKYSENVPNEMLRLLNIDRINSGILALDVNTGKAYDIALCRAAMMALTGSNNKNLSSYGNLQNMCSMYGISASSPSENMLVINSTSAEGVHNALQSTASSVRMSDQYTSVAIAIVVKDGIFYVDEVFIK